MQVGVGVGVGNGPQFSPGVFSFLFSFACILLGVGGRVRSSLLSDGNCHG